MKGGGVGQHIRQTVVHAKDTKGGDKGGMCCREVRSVSKSVSRVIHLPINRREVPSHAILVLVLVPVPSPAVVVGGGGVRQ